MMGRARMGWAVWLIAVVACPWSQGPCHVAASTRRSRSRSLRGADDGDPAATLARTDELRIETTEVAGSTVPERTTLHRSWFWEKARASYVADPSARAAMVYCSGDLLSAVQLSGVFEDSKEFVDMPMKEDPELIIQVFSNMSAEDRRDPAALRMFLDAHFHPAGHDLVLMDPPDRSDQPTVLRDLPANSSYHIWAAALNRDWQNLTRRVSDEVFENPQRFSLLRKRFPIVIPGGRFRESYYWDSYWIVLGLLACDMVDTARGLVQNLLDDLVLFGFVPNGGRVYYLNRSQPPLLSEMVMALLEHDPKNVDHGFVSWAVAALETEYTFWMRQGERAVTLTEDNGAVHVLNRYWTSATYPRPESYKEDVVTKLSAPDSNAGTVYASLAAGAESGWDYSSRWIVPSEDGSLTLSNIATIRVVPVELNCYMFRLERNLARLHEYLSTGKLVLRDYNSWTDDRARDFSDAAFRRATAIDRLMWSESKGFWEDYVLDRSHGAPLEAQMKSPAVSASGFLPLWSGLLTSPATRDAHGKVKTLIQALRNSTLLQVGGVRTTTVDTGEQWDSPNAWAPVQHMLVEGLSRLENEEASTLAHDIAKQWLASNYLGWVNSGGYMYEKYSAKLPGIRGEGGEYFPQVGFGWTNGVVLYLLAKYPDLAVGS